MHDGGAQRRTAREERASVRNNQERLPRTAQETWDPVASGSGGTLGQSPGGSGTIQKQGSERVSSRQRPGCCGHRVSTAGRQVGGGSQTHPSTSASNPDFCKTAYLTLLVVMITRLNIYFLCPLLPGAAPSTLQSEVVSNFVLSQRREQKTERVSA